MTWFSLLTLAVAFAGSVAAFTTLRFLAGLGLGAVLPTALAYMSEDAPPGGNSRAVTRVMTGYHVGAVLTALLALWLIDAVGLGGHVRGRRRRRAAGRTRCCGPSCPSRGPTSPAWGTASRTPARSPYATSAILRGRYLPVSIAICVASFMGLLLVYGLNTWLPKIMGEAGYSIKAGTGLLLILNVGAVIGLLIAGTLADARGNKPTVLLWFGLAAVFLALISIKMHSELLVYAAVLPRRRLRVQLPGAGLRVRRPPLPARGPWHRARDVGRRRPGRRDRRARRWAGPWSPPGSPTRGGSTPSRSLPSWPCWRWPPCLRTCEWSNNCRAGCRWSPLASTV